MDSTMWFYVGLSLTWLGVAILMSWPLVVVFIAGVWMALLFGGAFRRVRV